MELRVGNYIMVKSLMDVDCLETNLEVGDVGIVTNVMIDSEDDEYSCVSVKFDNNKVIDDYSFNFNKETGSYDLFISQIELLEDDNDDYDDYGEDASL